MRRFTRAVCTGALALCVGSWLGLGRPSVSQAKTTIFAAQNHLLNPPDPNAAPDPSTAPTVADYAPALAPDGALGSRLWPPMNPEASAKKAWLLAEGPYHPPGDNKRLVTFTFDDGPFPETTPSVLRLLAKYNLHATFFVLGRYLDGDDERSLATREVLKQIVAGGHLVGNHTHDHLLLTQLSREAALAQIDDGASSIERVIGKQPLVFRPPYGQVDAWTMQLLREKKQELVLWNVEAEDMKNEDAKAMYLSIKSQLDYAGGGIVLLHDIRPSTIGVLSMLLEWLSLHRYDSTHPETIGYEVTDLPAFLRATADAPQPYANRIELEHQRSAQHHKKHVRGRRLEVPVGGERKP